MPAGKELDSLCSMDARSVVGGDEGWRKGPWSAQEDALLVHHVNLHGEGKWNSVSKLTGLRRSGKSCRLRWVNYLRPDLKRGNITPQEEIVIQHLHALWGNRWSAIARNLPGRTDNEIKNYWRTHFKAREPAASGVGKARARFFVKRQQRRRRQWRLQQQGIVEGAQQQQQQRLDGDDDDEEEEVGRVSVGEAENCLALYGGGGFLGGYLSDGSWGCLWNLDDMPFSGIV